MKNILLAAAIAVFASCAPAMASACYTLSGDALRVCLAEERQDRSICYAVQDKAEKAKCLAKLSK